jgi:hypothetical protein
MLAPMSMTTILMIAVAIALLVLAVAVRALTGKQKKAEKWEKAQIVKRLVALSEQESAARKTASQQSISKNSSTPRRAAAGRSL